MRSLWNKAIMKVTYFTEIEIIIYWIFHASYNGVEYIGIKMCFLSVHFA